MPTRHPSAPGLPRVRNCSERPSIDVALAHLFRDDGIAAEPAKQRDVMRRIWAAYGPDEDNVVREYAAAEHRGEVARARNKYHIAAEDYARALLSDARRKGWLTGYGVAAAPHGKETERQSDRPAR